MLAQGQISSPKKKFSLKDVFESYVLLEQKEIPQFFFFFTALHIPLYGYTIIFHLSRPLLIDVYSDVLLLQIML